MEKFPNNKDPKKFGDIPMDKIKSLENIRTDAKSGLAELMQSIKQHGLLQKIALWTEGEKFYILFGHRRFFALKKLGWEVISEECYEIREKPTAEDLLFLNATENVIREDISPIELGRICMRLQEMGLSVSEITARLSMPFSKVRDAIDIYKRVPEGVREKIGYSAGNSKKSGKLPASSAVVIARTRISKDRLADLYSTAIKNDLTSEQVGLLSRILSGDEKLSVAKALENIDNMKSTSLTIILNKTVMNEVMAKNKLSSQTAMSRYLRDVLRGKADAVKGLVM